MLALNNRRREMSSFAFAVTVTFLNDLIPEGVRGSWYTVEV